MLTQATLGILSSLFGGTVVAVVTYLGNRKRVAAEARKLDAEAQRAQAETTSILTNLGVGLASTPNLPRPWVATGTRWFEYDITVDRTVYHTGSASVRIAARDGSCGFAAIKQSFNASIYRDRRLRMTGFVKTRRALHAALWMRVDGPADEMLAFDNMHNRSVAATQDWQQCQIILDIPRRAKRIVFGALLVEVGEMWVDDIEFDEVTHDVPVTDMLDGTPVQARPQNLSFED
ncbi:hypothetical protein [Plantactinospora soyae]|uniref:Uncharacterized protein n=1 Tax=Plantactinospora soyae TaxID=1544732 RepID=A0A927R1F7_9ACTN|nr:hypothetical protein [Plantactinospora soyae]MBE1491327.1 hypothetical protein [Plantactinospora soyae]